MRRKRMLYAALEPSGYRFILMNKHGRKKNMRSASGTALGEEWEQALRDFMRGESAAEAHLILSTEKAFFRWGTLPLISDKELDKAVPFLYKDHFPVPLETYSFDYRATEKTNSNARLLLGALPVQVGDDYLEKFRRLGIRLVRIDVVENWAGSVFTQGESALFFARQENTYRVLWIHNGELREAWRVTNHPEYGSRELKTAFSKLQDTDRIRRCVVTGGADDWLIEDCLQYDLSAAAADILVFLEQYASLRATVSGFNLLPLRVRQIAAFYKHVRRAALIAGAFFCTVALSAALMLTSIDTTRKQALDMAAKSMEFSVSQPNLEEIRLRREVEYLQKCVDSIDWRDDQSVISAAYLLSELPADVHVKSVAYQDRFLLIELTAQHSETITAYMRRIHNDGKMDDLSVTMDHISKSYNGIEVLINVTLGGTDESQ